LSRAHTNDGAFRDGRGDHTVIKMLLLNKDRGLTWTCAKQARKLETGTKETTTLTDQWVWAIITWGRSGSQ